MTAAGQAIAVRALWVREVVRFLRQRNRVVGALLTPVVFWLLLGSGLNRTFQPAPQTLAAAADAATASPGYLLYFFPGALLLVLMFTAVFATITVIEDRRSGLMQAILASPAKRGSLVMGLVLGGTTLAVGQGLLFLMLWMTVGPWPGFAGWAMAAGAMVLVAIGMTGLGLCLAWPMQSTAGFHAIMNLLLMPMWFLSGAMFPVETAPPWLRAVMLVNPLTYGHKLIAEGLLGPGQGGMLSTSAGLCWVVAALAAFTAIWGATKIAGGSGAAIA